ncbi:serine/threonine-protein kinase, partial [Actinoplanes siamensis]
MAVRQMLVAGRYRLLEPVGAGGMGRVWLARDRMLDRDVAIKEIVPPDWMSRDEKDRLRNRTLREARSAARLTHPHVVRVYDVVYDQGLSWIVMEYVPSRSLYQMLITKGPYPPAEAARIGLAVLDALAAAHRAGVLHRDVKPHNVLIGSDGRVLLTDFGLATFVDDGMITTPGLIVGSPQYVSPERARDGASTVESDLWSFGATLFATVEGQSPYARDSAMATLAALATEPPDQPVRAGPLGPIIEGLLRYEPEARLTAEETERRLRAVLDADDPGPPARRRPGATTGRPLAEPLVDRPSDEKTHVVGAVRAVAGVPAAALAAAPEASTDTDASHLPDTASGIPAAPGLPDTVANAPRPPLPGAGDLADTGPIPTAAPAEPPVSTELVLHRVPGEAAQDTDSSDDWHHDYARLGYIEGTFTVNDDPAPDPVPAAAAARAGQFGDPGGAGDDQTPRAPSPGHSGDRGGAGGNRRPAAPDASRSRPNRPPSAAGHPATTPSLRRGNQAPAHAIPAPRKPANGPPAPNQPPARRWPPRPRPTPRVRTRVAVACLLASVVLGGSVLGIHLIGQRDPAPQVVHPPASSASSTRASPGFSRSRSAPSASGSAASHPASPNQAWPPPGTSPRTTGFSPVVCDARPPAGIPEAPREHAARGVSGWALPAGWSYFTDGTGFHLPVPDGWTYQRIGSTYCFRDPRSTRVLSLDVGRNPGTDPIRGCRAEHQRLQQRRVRDYRLIALARVRLLHQAADWDYRYRSAAGALRRATTRWLVLGGHAYALGWATPEVVWATELSSIQMVRGTFYTDGPTADGPT